MKRVLLGPVLSAFCLILSFNIALANKDGQETTPLTQAQVLGDSKPEEWRTLDPELTLYVELENGRIIVELAPGFAPSHVANVKALAKERYFDGLSIIRVDENYVVQWGDPNAEDPELARQSKTAKLTLPPEFSIDVNEDLPFTSMPDGDVYAPEVGFIKGFPVALDKESGEMWLAHCYGMIGAGRGNSPDSGSGGTSIYVVSGHAPRHLDRNVTLFGRVIQGMELLNGMPRGKGIMGFYTADQVMPTINAIQLAAEVPESERTQVEILKTDSESFKDFIMARRTRSEDWYVHKAGRLDIGNIQVPYRIK